MFCGSREGSAYRGATSAQGKTVISNNQSSLPPKEWAGEVEGCQALSPEVPDKASRCGFCSWQQSKVERHQEKEETGSGGRACSIRYSAPLDGCLCQFSTAGRTALLGAFEDDGEFPAVTVTVGWGGGVVLLALSARTGPGILKDLQ